MKHIRAISEGFEGPLLTLYCVYVFTFHMPFYRQGRIPFQSSKRSRFRFPVRSPRYFFARIRRRIATRNRRAATFRYNLARARTDRVLGRRLRRGIRNPVRDFTLAHARHIYGH